MSTFTKVVNPGVEETPWENGYSFVKFFESPYPYENALEKTWTWLSHCANGRMQIAEVDCGKFPEVCSKHGICENPTILLFKDGRSVQEYKRLDFGYEINAFKRFLRPHCNLYMKDHKLGHSILEYPN